MVEAGIRRHDLDLELLAFACDRVAGADLDGLFVVHGGGVVGDELPRGVTKIVPVQRPDAADAHQHEEEQKGVLGLEQAREAIARGVQTIFGLARQSVQDGFRLLLDLEIVKVLVKIVPVFDLPVQPASRG